MYCVYFIDSESYETINVIENISSKVEEIQIINNDKYLFLKLSSSFIAGMHLNIYNDSNALVELAGKAISSNYFKLIFSSNFKNAKITSFDYDPILKILIAVDPINKILYSIGTKDDKKIKTQYYSNLTKIKLIKELNILIGGDTSGIIQIFSWPLKNYETSIKNGNIYDNLLSTLNQDLGSITSLINFKNYSSIITTTSNNSIYVNELLISKDSDFRKIEYFQKGIKPQIEMFINPYILYDIKTEDIIKKEKNVELMDKAKEVMKSVMDENIKEIENTHLNELDTMRNNLNQNTNDEHNKYLVIEQEINQLKVTMAEELEDRKKEMDNDKRIYKNKCEEKIELYDNEIERLQRELNQIKTDIENKYNTEGNSQREFYDKIMTEYNSKFDQLKKETTLSLNKLVNLSCEYNEATDQIVKDYKQLVEELDNKMSSTKEKNKKILLEKNNRLEEAKKQEDEHKSKLEEKIKDSDKLIEKNVEIKQSIINATQRTITFQEQLLETEKNLVKIDKKLEDLVVKNKHLEQIRFVLEHRMTSLEKEKSPLEGQCNFLENQKNKLTDEFNKIILQINVNNQNLENKQSQLRASLIQNYEAIDQKEYIEEKLDKLKTDLDKFIQEHKNFPENKVSQIALDFRDFYIKYFTNSIEYELIEYKFFSQKLKEQKEKEALLSNMDLIMRNKAEEKLITEKKKVDELRLVKENMFRRLHNENTILINECNRLRKNLHEIYLHVIDIEKRFENLTNIDPNLSKSQIVRQIKDFIKQTHEKIRENYTRNKKQIMLKNTNPINFGNKRYSTPINLARMRKNKSTNDIKSDYINFNKEKNEEIKQDNSIKEKKEDVNKNNDTENEQKNYYENIIQKPKYIKPNNQSLILKNNKYNINTNISISVKRGRIKLPSIRIKK